MGPLEMRQSVTGSEVTLDAKGVMRREPMREVDPVSDHRVTTSVSWMVMTLVVTGSDPQIFSADSFCIAKSHDEIEP